MSMQSATLLNTLELESPRVRIPLFSRGWVDLGPTSDGWTDYAAQPKMSSSPRIASTISVSMSRPVFRFRRPSDEAINTACLFSSY